MLTLLQEILTNEPMNKVKGNYNAKGEYYEVLIKVEA